MVCENNSVLLTLSTTVDSPHKGPVIRSFNHFFVVSLNKLLDKELSCRWCETAWCSCDVIVMVWLCFFVTPSVRDRFMWSVHPYFLGLLDWNWVNRMSVTEASKVILKTMGKIPNHNTTNRKPSVCIFFGIYSVYCIASVPFTDMDK